MSSVSTLSRDACLIIGAGGHAKVVLDILRGATPPVECSLLDSDASRWGTSMMGVPILGGDDLLPKLAQQGLRRFVIAMADVRVRALMFDLAVKLGLEPYDVIHATAVRSAWATLGAGLQMFAGSVVNPEAVVGANVILNTGAIVEHDCRLGDHVHIAVGARLCGGVQVGREAFIGAGAVVRQGVVIGDGAVVGAGAVVIHDVAAGIVVAGCPARPLEKSVGTGNAAGPKSERCQVRQ